MTERDLPGIIFPPPLLYAAGILLALGLDRLWPVTFATHPFVAWTGAVLMLLGVALNLWGAWSMMRARTPINPYHPVKAVVSSGAFRVSRNPLYVGLDLIFVGLFAWLQNPWGMALFVVLALVMHYGVILREERHLERKFGQSYRDYRHRVRRYL